VKEESMRELTEETVANAAAREREHHSRSRILVSRISDTEIAVPCVSGDHPEGHICRFERKRDGALFGECILRATGELCPSALGNHICFHLAAGVTLFLALEDRDALVEHAVRFDGPMPVFKGRFDHCRTPRATESEDNPDAVLAAPRSRKKVERVRGFQI
jgi:hypothetical protein